MLLSQFIPPSPSPAVDLLILNYSYIDYMHILHFSFSSCVESLIYSCCSWTSICLKGVNETLWPKKQHLVSTGFNWRLKFWLHCLQFRRPGFNLWVGKIPWRRAWQHTPVFLPGEFHGQKSLVGYSPGVAQSWILLTNKIWFWFCCFWPHYVACGLPVPQLGIESGPWVVKVWGPSRWTIRKFLKFDF